MKPQTGKKRPLEAVVIKPEPTMKASEEVEPKRAKLSLTKVIVKPDKGTTRGLRQLSTAKCIFTAIIVGGFHAYLCMCIRLFGL